jgi:ribonuclease HI
MKIICVLVEFNKSPHTWVAGVGGIIYKPEGNIVTNYAWGLGTLTTNEVESFVLYASIKLAISHQISNLIICGDSMLVIRAIIHKHITGGNKFKGIMFHILDILKLLNNPNLFHIKRNLNEEANKNAKIGSRLNKGKMIIKGELRTYLVP